MTPEEALKQINHGDVLLGTMHGLGVALHIHPGKGSLYINARSIIESNSMSEQCQMPDSKVPPRQETMAFGVLIDDLMRLNLQPVIENIILGAMSWIGDPGSMPGCDTRPACCVGACIADAVLTQQRKVDNFILYQLTSSIIIDQTAIASQVLGDPPDDAPYCWLVLEKLAKRLRAEHQIVHSVGNTHWWQQPTPLISNQEYSLLQNPVLQRIANKMLPKAWNP